MLKKEVNMTDSRLVNYIKSQLSKGASLEQIRQILIFTGWYDYQINPAVELATQQTISNNMQTFPSYRESVKESSNLRILLASGTILISGGVLALIILIIQEIVT
ncbi:MAG: hypothetical protein V1831_04365 [Candidatus Woesearchaeota archaeon]